MEISIDVLIFYLVSLVVVGSACIVAFSRNIVHSAFSLLGTFGGVAGLYVFLGADFVAAVQVLIYVGGILVLILFAVMLTHRISDIDITNRTVGRIPGLVAVAVFLGILVYAIGETDWARVKEVAFAPTTAVIGNLFLGDYLLPFQIAAVVLLVALIGAITLSRKEIKE
jgi:NADH-quinone oxidoreductase subunit J